MISRFIEKKNLRFQKKYSRKLNPHFPAARKRRDLLGELFPRKAQSEQDFLGFVYGFFGTILAFVAIARAGRREHRKITRSQIHYLRQITHGQCGGDGGLPFFRLHESHYDLKQRGFTPEAVRTYKTVFSSLFYAPLKVSEKFLTSEGVTYA